MNQNFKHETAILSIFCSPVRHDSDGTIFAIEEYYGATLTDNCPAKSHGIPPGT